MAGCARSYGNQGVNMSNFLSLRDFMEVVNYRISEGNTYGWNCYGPNAYSMDSWNGDHDGYSLSVVFDTATQTVYEMSACDYKRSRAYRWIHPVWRKAYEIEAKNHEVSMDAAWDDVKYIDLEVVEDLLEKCSSIINNKEYDTRVAVPIELDDADLMHLFKMAHERDITLNQLVTELLTNEIKMLS